MTQREAEIRAAMSMSLRFSVGLFFDMLETDIHNTVVEYNENHADPTDRAEVEKVVLRRVAEELVKRGELPLKLSEGAKQDA